MSRFPSLKNALVALLALSNVNGMCCPAAIETDEVLRLRRGELKTELAACLDDDSSCETLCHQLLIKRGFEVDPVYPPIFSRCIVTSVDEGDHILEMTYQLPEDCAAGRVPASPASGFAIAKNVLSRHLAGLAHLEAISVYAFVELARELVRHGAPPAFVERSLACGADEIDHATAMSALAVSYGATIEAPTIEARVELSLLELAIGNVAEGCVRELLGAAIALWQAEHASSAVLRQTFAVIAADEARHAELSFDLHRWLQTKLNANERAILETKRLASLASLANVAGLKTVRSSQCSACHRAAMLAASPRRLSARTASGWRSDR